MDFKLTSEQEEFRNSVRGFAQRHLAAGALERAHTPGFPWDVARLMAEQGRSGSRCRKRTAGRAAR